MEEELGPLALTHLLQHTLRSLCTREDSQWVYAVFWRILPRNYPPPKWDLPGAAYDRSGGNRRNWILMWEDGFCNFAASSINCTGSSSAVRYSDCEPYHHYSKGLQPELFFKMSHEIYNYGEGLIGKVAADRSHKWVFKEPPEDHEINSLSAWQNQADSYPRTWGAQFQSGIKTIALIAVGEGVVQLGAVNKVTEDVNYVVLLRKRFGYIESIPGVLLPHPSPPTSPAFPVLGANGCYNSPENGIGGVGGYQHSVAAVLSVAVPPAPVESYDHFSQQMRVVPSMSSLEALLSKLPSVGAMSPPLPPAAASSPPPPHGYYETPVFSSVFTTEAGGRSDGDGG